MLAVWCWNGLGVFPLVWKTRYHWNDNFPVQQCIASGICSRDRELTTRAFCAYSNSTLGRYTQAHNCYHTSTNMCFSLLCLLLLCTAQHWRRAIEFPCTLSVVYRVKDDNLPWQYTVTQMIFTWIFQWLWNIASGMRFIYVATSLSCSQANMMNNRLRWDYLGCIFCVIKM